MSELLDCGHRAKPSMFGPGFSVRTSDDGSQVRSCYDCLAAFDRQYAASMSSKDAPLLVYLSGPPGSSRVDVTTWAGVRIGSAMVPSHPPRHVSKVHVQAVIGGREFWGWTPRDSGAYVFLRPYAGLNGARR